MFAKVCFHYDFAISELIRNMLTDNGLHPAKLIYSGHVSLVGADQGYFVEVPFQEAEQAKKVLEENNLAKFIVRR